MVDLRYSWIVATPYIWDIVPAYAEATFPTMRASKREKRRRKICRSKDSRTDSGNREAASQEDPYRFPVQLASVNEKLGGLLYLKKKKV